MLQPAEPRQPGHMGLPWREGRGLVALQSSSECEGQLSLLGGHWVTRTLRGGHRGRWRLPVSCAGPQALAHHGGGGVLPTVSHLLPDVPLLRLTGPGTQDVHALLHLGPAGRQARERPGYPLCGARAAVSPTNPDLLARTLVRPLLGCSRWFSSTHTQSCFYFIDVRSHSSGR